MGSPSLTAADLVRSLARADLGIVQWDGELRVVEWSWAAERLFGYAAAEVVGTRAADRLEGLASILDEIVRRGEPRRVVLDHLTRAGRAVACEWWSAPLLDEHGRVAGVASAVADVTEWRKQDTELAQNNDLLRAIIDAAPTAIIGLDLDGKVRLVWNRAAQTMLGWSPEEVMGRYLPTVPVERDAEFQAFRALVRSGKTVDGAEVVRRRKDGSPIEYSIYTSALHTPDGAIIGNVAVLVDLTQRRRAEAERAQIEEQLRQAQRMEAVGRLAGGVAHDFNNMLSVILGYAELIRRDLPAKHAILADLGEIERAARRSKEVTSQLLALSRKQAISPRAVDMNELIEESLRTTARLLGEDIDLQVHRHPDLDRVLLDPSQFVQILLNLAVNARDAMPAGGRLTIETANAVFDEEYCRRNVGFSPGRYAMLAVGDSGSGMDKETLAHVFEPFFTTKEAGSGTGLGLAMVYGIVRQNDGHIHIYSEPGQGTLVKVYLPSTERRDAAVEVAPPPIAQQTGTVLVVEDSPAVREMVVRMLQATGYRVIAAASPAAALDECERVGGAIDVLLTDVVMPGMSGKELRDRFEARWPGVCTVFMSGYTANIVAHHGILEEGVYLLQKPFTIAELVAKLREAQAHARPAARGP